MSRFSDLFAQAKKMRSTRKAMGQLVASREYRNETLKLTN